MKQHSRDCIKFWRRGYHQSSLKHLEVNIQKILVMFWTEEFQKMINFIIINWFNRSGVWIWNWFRVEFNWKIWSGSFKITIINGMIIKYPYDSLNHRASVGRRNPVFEVSCRSLAVPFSLWIIWFIAMKGVSWFIFLLRLGGRNFGPRMMQASDLCPILPQNSQILFCLVKYLQ